MDGSPPAKGVLERAAILFRIVGALALLALTLTTVISVVWRYFLADPIFGVEDLSSLTLGVFVAAAIAVAAREKAHIEVDIVAELFGPRLRKATLFLAMLVGVGIVSVAAYALVVKGSCGQACGQFSPNLSIPHMPFYFLFAAAFAFYAIVLIVEAVRLLQRTDTRELIE